MLETIQCLSGEEGRELWRDPFEVKRGVNEVKKNLGKIIEKDEGPYCYSEKPAYDYAALEEPRRNLIS